MFTWLQAGNLQTHNHRAEEKSSTGPVYSMYLTTKQQSVGFSKDMTAIVAKAGGRFLVGYDPDLGLGVKPGDKGYKMSVSKQGYGRMSVQPKGPLYTFLTENSLGDAAKVYFAWDAKRKLFVATSVERRKSIKIKTPAEQTKVGKEVAAASRR